MKIILSFKRYPVAALLLFLKAIVKNMKDKARYAAEKPQLGNVEIALTEFDDAATEAKKGGKLNIENRDIKKAIVLAEMDVLVMLMELHTNEDITFFTEAGFSVRKTPVRQDGDLPKPVLKFVHQGVKSASLDGETTTYPTSVNQLAVRSSDDGGKTWVNGTYSSGKRFSLVGLVPRKEYLISVCFHGTRQRMSDWSEPKTIFLL